MILKLFNNINLVFNYNFLDTSFRIFTIIFLASLGGALCMKVGIFNVSLEGLLLLSCFTAVAGNLFFNNALIGTCIAVIVNIAFSLIFCYLVISLKIDSIVIGISLNILISGITSFFMPIFFGNKGVYINNDLEGLPKIFGNTTFIPYISIILAFFFILFFNYSIIGFRIHAIGKESKIATNSGVLVNKYKYIVILISSFLCGLGGAQLALGNVTLFSENMTSGRGWIAVVIIMLANANIYSIFFISLIFAVIESLGFYIQSLDVPYQITSITPYIFALFALILRYVFKRYLNIKN